MIKEFMTANVRSLLRRLAETDTSARVSGESPFADCNILLIPGETNYVNATVEPWVAVNPRDRANIVGVWQQDRFTFGGARGLPAGDTGGPSRDE